MVKERRPSTAQGKLAQRRFDPYKVLRKINNNAYVIALPEDIGVSNTFNVADLTPFYPEDTLYDRSWSSSWAGRG